MLQLSVRNFNFVISLSLLASFSFSITACANAPIDTNQPLVQDQYRLQEDRKALDEVRKDVPAEKKSENDELAFLLNLTGNLDRTPSQIREKFSSLVSKKREKFQKDMTKKRENYVQEEKRQRDEFTKKNDEERKEFGRTKANSEERREFYSQLDAKRQSFYQTIREKRDEFEADMRDQRKNFDDYMHEKNSEFGQEMRAYQSRYDENKKQKELEKKNKQNPPQAGSATSPNLQKTVPSTSALKAVEKEFESVDQKPAQSIGTEE